MSDKQIETRKDYLNLSQYITININTPFIWTDVTRCGGMPCLRNHRITISQLLGELSERGSIGSVCEAFSLEEVELKGMLRDLSDLLCDG